VNTTPKRGWFHLTPDQLLLALLPIWGGLFLAEHFGWLPKGQPEVLAVGATAAVLVSLLSWFAIALVFRWRFQYSLRSLLLVMLLTSIGMSWVGVRIWNTIRQKQAVAAIKRVGGTTEYDSQGNVDSVVIVGGIAVTDADFEHFHDLTHLQSLFLIVTPITDGGLAHLKGLTQLNILVLDNTRVSDAGLEHLNGLPQLESLFIDNAQVTDAGLQHLNHLNSLRLLYLRNTHVTDDGVKDLQEALPNCKIDH